MIDPEFWSDEQIGSWSHQARLFYIGLWNFSDDEGRFKANDLLLKSQIFPYDKRVDIKKLKAEVSEKIIFYVSDTLQYGYLKNFLKYQRIDRPTLSVLPSPPKIDEQSTNDTRVVPAKLREVKLREVKLSKGCVFDFEEIWSKYPNKLGKKAAEKHFHASVKTEEDYTKIKTALDNFLNSKVALGDPKYIPHGSTWFNNWQDWVEYKEDKYAKYLKKD